MKNVIKKVAEENNTHPFMVKYHIAKAIEEAMKSGDPKAQAFWKEVAPGGTPPTPEELIKTIREKVLESL